MQKHIHRLGCQHTETQYRSYVTTAHQIVGQVIAHSQSIDPNARLRAGKFRCLQNDPSNIRRYELADFSGVLIDFRISPVDWSTCCLVTDPHPGFRCESDENRAAA